MTIAESGFTAPSPAVSERVTQIQWAPIIAGSIIAAAVAFVLHSFAAAIGLAVSSTAPTWRDASVALWLLSGIYLIAVALISYGLGAYVAGRLRARFEGISQDEGETRDGVSGLMVWALATLITGLLVLFAASAAPRLIAPSGGSSGPASSVAGENIIALELDRLFRSERRVDSFDPSYTRAEAARILLTASAHSGVAAEDRNYLIRLIANTTGLAPADAEKRVDVSLGNSRQSITRARRSTVILAFMAGVAAVLGGAVAWFAAIAGGRHRDNNLYPTMDWRQRSRS